ncbi:hypothetical protein ABTZ03_18940 [Kitasatospora sp. NPDC096077]|uniref:hypothetical protein n=1 Tax=Kitasatospora sp. NPDC096077 TaxID=3155544 RepID=UPI00331DA1A2
MSSHSGSARALRAAVLLLALPLLATCSAAVAAPVGPRPMAPCADGTQHAHHRPLPPPAQVVGGPVRRSPARPCL